MIYSYHDVSIYAKKLVTEIKGLEYEIGHRKFTTEIIGELRKYGIIISGTKQGYRLATTKVHVDEYIKYDENIIFPMLNKILVAKKGILKASSNKIDLLNTSSTISKVLDVYEKNNKN